MDWKALLFSFQGRIPRKKYWIAILLIIFIGLLLFGLFVLLANAALGFFTAFLIGLPLFIPFVWAGIAVPVKRLHDRNKSGWYYLLYFTLPNVLDRLSDKIAEGSALWWIVLLAGLVIGIWAIVDLGFLKGTNGDNNYGSDPLEKQAV